jgi:hypothetical protein
LPVLLPLALIAGLIGKGRGEPRTPAEIAGFISDFIEDSGGDWDWDEFENTPITDPKLEELRQRAIPFGPPNPDIDGLRSLLAEMRATYPEVR